MALCRQAALSSTYRCILVRYFQPRYRIRNTCRNLDQPGKGRSTGGRSRDSRTKPISPLVRRQPASRQPSVIRGRAIWIESVLDLSQASLKMVTKVDEASFHAVMQEHHFPGDSKPRGETFVSRTVEGEGWLCRCHRHLRCSARRAARNVVSQTKSPGSAVAFPVCRISPTYHPIFSQRSWSVSPNVATQFHHGSDHPRSASALSRK